MTNIYCICINNVVNVVFGGPQTFDPPQEGYTVMPSDDPRYVAFYDALPDYFQANLVKPGD